jgi:cobalt-zinc-cadmium efflux system outer membrane protein
MNDCPFRDKFIVSLPQEVELKNPILRCGLAICLVLLVPVAGWSHAKDPFLDSLIAEALKTNPDLRAAQHRYLVFEAKIPQAGSLPDPMFKATLSNLPTDSWKLDRTPMSGIELTLTQTIPFPGKLGSRKNIAQNLAGKAEKEYESIWDFIVAELKTNYHQLYLIEKSIQITQQNKSLLQDFAEIASTRYSVGSGLQQDVLKAQVEVSKMTDVLISLEEMKRIYQAKINVLLDRDPQDSLGRPQDPVFRELGFTELELQKMALAENPALQGMDLMVKAAESSYRLAKKQYLPDFTLSASYRLREEVPMDPVKGVNFFSASAGINIPLYFWSKQKKQVHEKKLDWKSAGEKYESTRNTIKLSVSRLFYSLEKYREEVQLYGTSILSQARQSLESARSGYQVGKVDFLTLLNNQVTLFNYEIAYHQAISSYFMTVAKLEEMVGKPLLVEGE